MSRKLIELFQRSINSDSCLQREGRSWLLQDNNCKISLRVSNRNSLGFSLDHKSQPSPFPFFSSKPPSGIATMCDAIVALSYKNKAYIFVIEQKTNNQDSYKKQLANGKYFCDWLLMLLKEHKHYSDTPIFIGLLCWRPREKSPDKGTTTHGISKDKKQHSLFNMLYETSNQEEIYLQELADDANGQSLV